MEWTPNENAKIIGMLPEYRSYLKSGMLKGKARELIAEKLLSEDNIGIFEDRKNSVQDIMGTMASHIKRMNDIASGLIHPEHGDEQHWGGCFPEKN